MTFELTIPRTDLARLASSAHGVAKDTTTLHVLKAALLDASNGMLRVSATDTFISVQESVKVDVKSSGTVAVNARQLHDVVSRLQSDVTLTLVKDQLVVRSGKTNIKLPTLAAEDFPQLPDASAEPEVALLDATDLSRAIRQADYAMVQNDAMPVLGSLSIESDGRELTCASTDKGRLAVSRLDVSGAKALLLVPMEAVKKARKLAELAKDKQVSIRANSAHVFFCAPGTTLSARLMTEVAFLPWRKVVPKSYAQRVTFDRAELSGALRRIETVAEKDGAIDLTFSEGSLRVSAAGLGEGFEDVDCDATADLTVSVTPSYVIQAVDVVPDDEVVLELGKTERDVLVIRGSVTKEVFGLVMPRSRAGV